MNAFIQAKPAHYTAHICLPVTGYGPAFRIRPMATITRDTLDWYGWDDDGLGADVIGTRCDPYTAKLLRHHDYHHCCHSNLIRTLRTTAP